eukprot:NODE_464_length_8145_cov_0.677977.p3 type:complete len:125 gc:universal NODE_464_length_8145_cov_0.677977:5271-5645(+)
MLLTVSIVTALLPSPTSMSKVPNIPSASVSKLKSTNSSNDTNIPPINTDGTQTSPSAMDINDFLTSTIGSPMDVYNFLTNNETNSTTELAADDASATGVTKDPSLSAAATIGCAIVYYTAIMLN